MADAPPRRVTIVDTGGGGLGRAAMCGNLVPHMAFTRAGILIAALVVLGAAPQNPLVRARQLYNQQQYDAAIAAAREARARPDLAEAAAVVLGRAHLERYRTASDTADLAAARESLVAVDTARLTPRDRLELLIGLGELLYFEGHFGAAAELFGAALGSAAAADGTSRESVLDWWAMALDHEAQDSGDAERRQLYARMLRLVEPAVGRRPPVGRRPVLGGGRGGRHGRLRPRLARRDRGVGPRAARARTARRASHRPRAARAAGHHPRARGHAAACGRSQARPSPTCRPSGPRSRSSASGADARGLLLRERGGQRGGLVGKLLGEHEVLHLQRVVGLLEEPLRGVVLRAPLGR